jgi:hypothetical protein
MDAEGTPVLVSTCSAAESILAWRLGAMESTTNDPDAPGAFCAYPTPREQATTITAIRTRRISDLRETDSEHNSLFVARTTCRAKLNECARAYKILPWP